jgi:phosphatidylglycerophosphatase A
MKNPVFVWIQRAAASLMFLGYIPFASGTIGSAVTVGVLWWFFGRTGVAVHALDWWALSLAVTAFSLLVSSCPKDVFGSDDPKEVIIDECAGQVIAFLFVPITLKTLLLGFFLFRFFDVVKPYPVHNMESLEGGLGITMDDVVAGVLTNITLLAILYGYHFVKHLL